jgi:putative DNA methylase
MTYRKKLIEVALPLEDINREAAREKSIRHGHPSTLHLWWARRPLAACRAVLFASLVDDPSEHLPELLADAGKRAAAEKELKVRKKAWAELKVTFEKASGAGMKSVPDPGPEPKIEDVIEEQERERLFGIIRELVKWDNSNNERVLKMAREEILKSTNGKPPPVYDPFCGGGSIPLEAQRLGLEAHASDLNPVPVLINKALIEIPPKFADKPPVNPEARRKFTSSGSWKGAAGLAEDIRYYGQWMRNEAEKRVGQLYPKVKLPKEHGGGEAPVIAWLWARTVKCPNPACGNHTPLLTSFVLSSKEGQERYLWPTLDKGKMNFQVRGTPPPGFADPKAGLKRGMSGIFECVFCKMITQRDYVAEEAIARRLGRIPTAVVSKAKQGRIYLEASSFDSYAQPSEETLSGLNVELAANPRDVWCRNFGLTKASDLFTERQLATLTSFCGLIPEAMEQIKRDMSAAHAGAESYAEAIATYLGIAVSKLADYNSTLVAWSPTRDQAKSTFARQALPMVWDFTEVNPFAEGAGDLLVTIHGIARTVERFPTSIRGGFVQQKSATKIEVQESVLFSTDPPYYDNIGYADLSDFFYVWLRKGLNHVYPTLFSTVLVPKAEELIVSATRYHGETQRAKEFFENGLNEVFGKLRAFQSSSFPCSVYYAFKQAEETEDDDDESGVQSGRASTGWETMLQSLVAQGFQITGTWPIRTERGARSVSLGTNALASSIVLVCRPRPKDAGAASRRDLLAAMKKELPEALRDMQKGNIAPVDLAQAAIGPGMAVFSRYAKVLEADGAPMSVRTALALINQTLDEVLAEQEGEFDADTRWALAWFDQNGFNEGAYGVAETLCTAKNTSVSGMVEAGILAAKGGKVRLLKKEEMQADWNPATDERLTVWEATHHLIRSLDKGEAFAAGMLKQLGAMAEVARDLSYRLYNVCERRKWSQEALGYNALVLSWPDLKRLADEQKDLGAKQRELI